MGQRNVFSWFVASAVWLVSACGANTAAPGGDGDAGSGGSSNGGSSSSGAPNGGSSSNPCAVGLAVCSGACVDVRSDVGNCGSCGNTCAAGLVCSEGACRDSCANGLTLCGAGCADLASSVSNCGACGTRCGAGQSCASGVCTGGGGQGGAGGSGVTGGTGGSATGGTGGAGAIPPGLPGVVVGTDSAGTLGCVPLCLQTEHPDDPNPADDWAYEGYSCILPASATATRNQACTTGQPLPPIDRNGIPGVVVATDSMGTLACVPLCMPGAMPSSPEPSAADWGWEYQATCIIRDTPTARCNQGCSTGMPLPSATLIQRPGLLVNEACVGLCACGQAGMDPSYGWEFQQSCIVPNSMVAMGKLACTTNDAAPLKPPPVSGTTVQPGFYVQNGKLYDAKGTEFVMRGVNNPHIWFDPGSQYRAYQALDAIASYKTNTIRVVWETTGGSASLLARILYRIVELKMVPMVELHDATGSQNAADLQRMAAYYTQADIKQVLTDYRAYLLVNIANEWSGTGGTFQSAYQTAITTLRSAGIEHTLVIDGSGYGQDANSLFNAASALTAHDPLHNLLFSVHMYSQYPSSASVDAVLDRAVSMGVPLIVGEFGPQLQGTNVAWQQILTKSQANRIGYIAWSWSGNDAMTANLNIVNDFSTQLTASWGRQVMVDHAASIQKTAVKASIFP
jgi:mannan endo-1,4-beta-mannosidase